MQRITVYSTPTCPYCHKIKEYLKKKNIEFRDIDVTKNRKDADEIIKKSGQMGVPIIEIGKEIVIGADIEKIEKLLKK